MKYAAELLSSSSNQLFLETISKQKFIALIMPLVLYIGLVDQTKERVLGLMRTALAALCD
jgi:hypothetical protein